MRKTILTGLVMLIFTIVLLCSTGKVYIKVDTKPTQVNASGKDIADADYYLDEALKYKGSTADSSYKAQLAEAMYVKEIYKLLLERGN